MKFYADFLMIFNQIYNKNHQKKFLICCNRLTQLAPVSYFWYQNLEQDRVGRLKSSILCLVPQ